MNARATSSLPTPLSPVINTVSAVGATCWILCRSDCIADSSRSWRPRAPSAATAERGAELAVPQSPGDELFDLVHIERLLDVVKGPMPHRLDGGSHGSVGRHHDDLASSPRSCKARMNSRPFIPGICRSVMMTSYGAVQPPQCLDGTGIAGHLMARAGENVPHGLPGTGMIVDNQDPAEERKIPSRSHAATSIARGGMRRMNAAPPSGQLTRERRPDGLRRYGRRSPGPGRSLRAWS